jgi:fimbrial chaperone protein
VRRLTVPISSTVLVLTLFCAAESWASTFNVSPLQVVLSTSASSALVEIRNQAMEPLRLQLSVTTWEQSPAGEMIVTPTEDLVMFPTLVALEPGETRKVRLGTASPASATERAYRVFVEELPSREEQAHQGGNIRVLTRLSIPVFLQPGKHVAAGNIQGIILKDGVASFEIENTGNVHFSPRHIRVIGMAASGDVIGEQGVEGWYILAGGSRRYDVPFSTITNCSSIRRLAVEAETDIGTLKKQADVPSGACGR